MTKLERQAQIKNLLTEGKTEDEIVALLLEGAGVQEPTLRKQIQEMSESEKENKEQEDQEIDEHGNPGKTLKIEMSESEKENKELQKGRVYEYFLKDSEVDSVHFEFETVALNKDFKKTSKPQIQIVNLRQWALMRTNLKLQGFTHVRVLHAPEGTNTELENPVGETVVLGK